MIGIGFGRKLGGGTVSRLTSAITVIGWPFDRNVDGLVAEHKQQIGFTGTLLLEPKPQEPTKHQYDYDVATVDSDA